MSDTIFKNASDKKKAAGRALGTLVELITYYWLNEFGFRDDISIEHGLIEFGNDEITHNVEFGIHPRIESKKFNTSYDGKNISIKKIAKVLFEEGKYPELLSGNLIQNVSDGKKLIKNACSIARINNILITCNVNTITDNTMEITMNALIDKPYAIVECKRVGVEDGARKGPTTIEKAKQGAYVASHASKLQKIKDSNGNEYGAIPNDKGGFIVKPYADMLHELLYKSYSAELEDMVLTIGITSNHGNWFTSNSMNKELKVLRQSYDWLLFLNDIALCQFISDLILNETSIKKAFEYSYSGERKKGEANWITKSKLESCAHSELIEYFHTNHNEISQNWFSVLSPSRGTIDGLVKDLSALKEKEWK